MSRTSTLRLFAACMPSKTTAEGSAPALCLTTSTPTLLAPGVELLDGGGAKSIAGDQQYLFAIVAVLGGELADGGGLADAVDAEKDDHPGARRKPRASWARRLSRAACSTIAACSCADISWLRSSLLPGACRRSASINFSRGFDADIGGDQALFHLVQRLFVPLAILQDRADLLHPGLAAFGQSLFEPLKKSADCHASIFCEAVVRVKRRAGKARNRGDLIHAHGDDLGDAGFGHGDAVEHFGRLPWSSCCG